MALLMLLLMLAIICVFIHYYERRNLPPGPPCLPLIGSLPFLSSIAPQGFLDLTFSKKYGKICKVEVLTQKLFVINDFQLAKDLFGREEMCGRPPFFYNSYVKGYDGDSLGLISSDGHLWQSQKRYSLMTLKNLGFGKKTMESVIYEEVGNLFHHIEEKKDSSGELLVNDLFNISIVNVIWQIIASTRCDYRKKEDIELVEGIANLLKVGFDIRNLYRALYWVLPYSQTDLSTLKLKDVIEKLVDEHDENLDVNAPNDYIDFFLIEMRKGSDPFFTKKQLVVTCLDFFIAGSDTSSTTLTWALLYMILHEDIQEKCFREIYEVIGFAHPREEDVSNLPFCMATLNEIQRLGNTAPGSLFHVNTTDIQVEGYTIPKNNLFIANLRQFHLDDNVFEDPHTFNPYRFYNKKVNPQFVPFSLGKRICIGISMAKKELYYFFIMFLQKYKISSSRIHGPPDPNNMHFGATTCPYPFHIQLSERKQE